LISLKSALSEKVARQLVDMNVRLTADMDSALETNKRLLDSESMLKSGLKKIQDEIVRTISDVDD
jgi:hypothetical protein